MQSTMLIDAESLIVSYLRLIHFVLIGFMASNYYQFPSQNILPVPIPLASVRAYS
jgi:hypothetical protein